MKLIFAIVQNEDARPLRQALVSRRFGLTRLKTAGGFLFSEPNATFIIGVEDDQVDEAIGIIGEQCTRRVREVPTPALGGDVAVMLPPTIEVEVGGAVVFVLPVEQMLRF